MDYFLGALFDLLFASARRFYACSIAISITTIVIGIVAGVIWEIRAS